MFFTRKKKKAFQYIPDDIQKLLDNKSNIEDSEPKSCIVTDKECLYCKLIIDPIELITIIKRSHVQSFHKKCYEMKNAVT